MMTCILMQCCVIWKSLVIAHGYFGVNEETVWDIVENEIPLLLTTVKTLLGEK